MAFGERPYWDMSNHEVCFRFSSTYGLEEELFWLVYYHRVCAGGGNVEKYSLPIPCLFKIVKSMQCLHSVVFSSPGHEGYQRGLQASCTDGLPLRYLPAHAPVLAERSLQTTPLLRHRQHFGQTA